jgi:hypothetical protein
MNRITSQIISLFKCLLLQASESGRSVLRMSPLHIEPIAMQHDSALMSEVSDSYFLTIHALTDAWNYLGAQVKEQLSKMIIEV